MSQFRKKYKVISNLKAAKLLLRRAAPGFFGRRTLSHSCLIYEPSFSTLLFVFCFVMFSIGERSPESSTIKPYCSNSYRMQFTVACWKMQALPWKRCFREALMHIPVVQAVNSIDTNAPRYHQHCRLLNRYLLASLVWRLWRPCIPKRISNFDSSDDRVVLHIDRDDYKVHIWLLLCITELVLQMEVNCFQTMISGSIPEPVLWFFRRESRLFLMQCCLSEDQRHPRQIFLIHISW